MTMENSSLIRLGTRGSRLALRQTEIVAEQIRKALPETNLEIVTITTSGDSDQKTPLSQLGGKGVFIKELEYALCAGQVDIAVHSFKDVTCDLAPGCALAGFLEPESQADVLVLREGESLREGMVIGTGSLRRKVLLKHRFSVPVSVQDIRGNVDTRIRKVDEGVVDGVLLSEAGVIRLGLQHRISERLQPASFYPAPGQGVIALECRSNDALSMKICCALTPMTQMTQSSVHLEVLHQVGFDCRDPLGVFVTTQHDVFSIAGFAASHSLESFFDHTETGLLSEREIVVQKWVDAIKVQRGAWL